MNVVFSQSLSSEANKLVESLQVDNLLLEAEEDKETVKDMFTYFVVRISTHLVYNEMPSVDYDDISEVAKRLNIMLKHK